jgi:lipoprotein-releasing system permease protein
MLKLFLWLRYLRKKKIVFLSIAAVALSVALMIVVDSLFSGYIDGLKRCNAAEAGDIFVWKYGRDIPQYDVFLSKLEELEGVEGAAPYGVNGGLLYLDTGDVREVVIEGLEPEREKRFTDWNQSLLRQRGTSGTVNFEVPGYTNADGCWLGVNVAAEPNEETDEYDLTEVEGLIGKSVVLTTTAASGKRKVVTLRVSDIAFTKTYYGDRTLYVPLEKLSTIMFGEAEERQVWTTTKIKLKDGFDAVSMKAAVRGVWERFAREYLGWEDANALKVHIGTEQENRGEWYAELEKQMAILLLIFGVICSVVVLLVFCIFYMIVETKRKDIAIIKSCGAGGGTAAWIFLGFGGCVGIAGSAFGIIVGYIVTRNVNTLEEWVRIVFGLKLWRSSSYMLNSIPNEVYWAGVWPIVLLAVAGCCLGALIPAIVAARAEPVKILRYE